VWVANWVDGTVTEVDTATMTAKSTVDLNKPLYDTGLLGQLPLGLGARSAMAHPRSLAITNNKDQSDDDESIYVTEYFAQQTAAAEANGANADTRKAGIVYRIKLSDRSVSTIQLGAMADIGFKDQNNGAAGCYPNQVQAIGINGKFAYVVSICASPKGPIGPRVTNVACAPAGTPDVSICKGAPNNMVDPVCVAVATGGSPVCVDTAGVKTATSPVISVIDLTTYKEVEAARANLNASFTAFYAGKSQPDDGTRRFPLVANDIAFVPGTSVGYVSANGADAVFRVKFDPATGSISEVGSTAANFINLTPKGANDKPTAGIGPIGVAATSKSTAFAANDITRNLSIIDLNTQTVAGGGTALVATSPAPTGEAEKLAKGKRFFNTGMGRWSLKGQGWGSCQSCHIDGLTDNVTWHFARGPRQSTSLDGTYASKDPTDQRIMNWTAIFDEMADFELNTRGVSGGIGAIVHANTPANTDRVNIAGAGPQGGLFGSTARLCPPGDQVNESQPVCILQDWHEIDLYTQTIRSPRKPSNLDAAKVAQGKTHFESDAKCTGCHSGAKWTISKLFYKPDAAVANLANNQNEKLRTTLWVPPPGFPNLTVLPSQTPANRRMRFDSGNVGGLDQIQCILRNVGTFNVSESGVGISELRADMTAAAQGNQADGNGYNPPSLLGQQVGAPFLHGGQARTLEALFLPQGKGGAFAAHFKAFSPNFLDDTDDAALKAKIEALVQYILSIDEDTPVFTIPTPGAGGGDFCAPAP
jgi:hypothetical protein